MREIRESGPFKHDIKREAKGQNGKTLAAALRLVLMVLANDELLEPRYALTGNWRGCRDSHVKPNLVLIYRKPNAETLELLRLGSHSELRL